ncbi:hypothetical protein ASE38_07475 [Cellulomonas sp. Root930]|nr:hypothetical protein ASE38_07475 [Cellulomonas sp. Root930]
MQFVVELMPVMRVGERSTATTEFGAGSALAGWGLGPVWLPKRDAIPVLTRAYSPDDRRRVRRDADY